MTSAFNDLRAASRVARPLLSTRRGVLMAAVAATLPVLPGALRAQPATSRIVVGFAPGGGADLVARLLVDRLTTRLGNGHRVIVENRPGGAGKIAVDALRSAPADGGTLLLAPLVTPVLSQLVFRNPGYDPARDFAPVGLVAHFQFALAVAPDHPARDVRSFVAWLKANPAKANFGSPSAGSLPHFFGLLLGAAAGVDFTHVSYRGGSPMLTDLVGGQITSGIDTVQELLELQRAGKLRIIGTFSDHRVPQWPNVPTFAEQGFPRATGSGWYSLWTTAGTPADTVSTWNRALVAVLEEPAVRQKFAEWALETEPGSPEALDKLRVADLEKWRPIIAASGFKAD